MIEKICPVMSRAEGNATRIEDKLYFVNCRKDKCQWWWKCREPANYSISENGEISHEGRHEKRLDEIQEKINDQEHICAGEPPF